MVTYLLDVSGAIDLGFLYTFSGIVMFVYCCVLCTGRYVNIFQSYFTELLQSDVYISTHPGPYFDNLLSNILLKLVPYHVGITICVWLARNSMFGRWHPTKSRTIVFLLWGGVSIDYIASGVLRHAVIRFWINSEIVIFTFEVLHDNNTIASFSFIYLLVPPSYHYC